MKTATQQGVDKGSVFQSVGFLYFLAVSALSRLYTQDSEFLVAQASLAAGGLIGKRVMDLGAGHGSTTLAIAKRNPSTIVSVDKSVDYIPFLEMLFQSDKDIEGYLEANYGARKVLDDLYDATIAYLEGMRKQFQATRFSRLGGTLQLIEKSAFDLTAKECDEPVDVIIGSHFFHWVVNALKDQYLAEGKSPLEARDCAISESLERIGKLLKPGGILAFSTSKDFVDVDDNPEMDQYLEQYTVTAEPMYVRMHEIKKRLVLKKNPALESKVTIPAPNHLLKNSEIPALFRRSGFNLVHVDLWENLTDYDPIEVAYTALQLHLGGLKDEEISAEDRVEIAKKVRKEMRETMMQGQWENPYMGFGFTYIFQKA